MPCLSRPSSRSTEGSWTKDDEKNGSQDVRTVCSKSLQNDHTFRSCWCVWCFLSFSQDELKQRSQEHHEQRLTICSRSLLQVQRVGGSLRNPRG
ncbi:hypothetical protein COCON_G00096340 [Conger conger]|uniref:Uncharacterized protein n=1 Tax=Conger conger TaxID=82655 RepID=A0A9Q1DMB5_CONCO|nr:hypothetical protein COCON_G00096340 [Conger conger]